MLGRYLKTLLYVLVVFIAACSCVEEQVPQITNNDRGISAKPIGRMVDALGKEAEILLDYDCVYDTLGNGYVNGFLKHGDTEWAVIGTRDGNIMILNVGEYMVMNLKETGYYPERTHKFEFEGTWNTLSGERGYVILTADADKIADFYARNNVRIAPEKLEENIDTLVLAENKTDLKVETVATKKFPTEVTNVEKEAPQKENIAKKEPESKKEPAQPKWGDCKLNGKIGNTNVYLNLSNGYNGSLNYGGNSNKFKVNGVMSGNNLTLTELHRDTVTGVYNGSYDGFKYKGTYKRKDGKTFSFVMNVR